MHITRRLATEQRGEAMVEYALVMGLIAAGLVVLLVLFRNAAGRSLDRTASAVSGAAGNGYGGSGGSGGGSGGGSSWQGAGASVRPVAAAAQGDSAGEGSRADSGATVSSGLGLISAGF